MLKKWGKVWTIPRNWDTFQKCQETVSISRAPISFAVELHFSRTAIYFFYCGCYTFMPSVRTFLLDLQFIILLFTCRYSSNSGAWLGFESTRICSYADKDVAPTTPTPRSHDSCLSMYRYNCFTCKHQVWTWNQALLDTTMSAYISFPWFLS